MTPKEFLEILHTTEKLKDATRHCTTSNRRTESVAEHSWRISLMAYMLKSEFKEVDITPYEDDKEKIVKWVVEND